MENGWALFHFAGLAALLVATVGFLVRAIRKGEVKGRLWPLYLFSIAIAFVGAGFLGSGIVGLVQDPEIPVRTVRGAYGPPSQNVALGAALVLISALLCWTGKRKTKEADPAARANAGNRPS